MVQVLKILRSIVTGNRPTGRLYGEPYVNFADNQFGVFNSSNVAQDLIGLPVFSPSTSYTAGQGASHLGIPYVALVAVSPAAWNPAQWSQIQGASQIQSVNRNYIAGLTLATAGGVATFTVSPGQFTDSTNVLSVKFPSTFTKTTGAFVAGTGNGALDTGTIAANTWYHVHMISNAAGSSVDVIVSLSVTAPTLPSGYTLFRRIGAMRTDGSSHWIAFIQNGDEFLWVSPPQDLGAITVTTAGALYTFNVPPGLKVNAILTILAGGAASSNSGLNAFSPDQASGTVVQIYNTAAGAYSSSNFNLRTNTSGQLYLNAVTANAIVSICTLGWIDRRGRDL
jgi:hypothetical protein